MNKRDILLLLLLLLVCCACSSKGEDEPPVPQPDFVELDAEVYTAGPTGGDVVVRIRSNKPWTLSFDDKVPNPLAFGVIQTRTGDAGEGEAVFTAYPNTGTALRSVDFKITAGRASASFRIVQDVVEVMLPSEDQVKAFLLNMFDDPDDPDYRFRKNWSTDKPLSQWGTEVHYNNGRLELYLNEHLLKGKINLAGCKALVSLRCSKNQITEIDVSDCPLLTNIDCTNNLIKKLDVSGCYSLRDLYAGYNNLTGIDIGWCTTLQSLWIENCGLTELDLSRCVSIQRLSCHDNRLRELDIPYRANNLHSLWCYANELTHLDVSNSPWLGMFNCGDNMLETLDVSGCIRLSGLFCYNNRLRELKFDDAKESLSQIYCYTNKLSEIDVAGCRKLHELHCSDNDISVLDLSGCRSLGWLYCSYNKIEELDFSDLDKHIFVRLDCSYNHLRKADITSMTYLLHLWCAGNYIGGEIPEWFSRLEDFEYDVRYEYRPQTGSYTDRGYGWWYPGEPGKMCHQP